jgi:hypothetical protein
VIIIAVAIDGSAIPLEKSILKKAMNQCKK